MLSGYFHPFEAGSAFNVRQEGILSSSALLSLALRPFFSHDARFPGQESFFSFLNSPALKAAVALGCFSRPTV